MFERNKYPTFQPKEKPRSLYIHIPFCRHRCGYCNFTLVAGRDYLVDRFLDAIENEFIWLEQTYEVDTIFLGGGTPSHLSAENMQRLCGIIRSRFSFADNFEFTAECNPSDVTDSCAEALAEIGVNRISLGVQSLNSQKLKTLERDHSREIVIEAIANARRFCKNVSIDLIFATPNETLEEWRTDLDQAIALQPDHVSTYELTYEKGTAFWTQRMHGNIDSADEELRCKMYEHAIATLSENGFEQYEVSSFAKPNYRCRHNVVYWSGKPYFAFGPGASRFIDGTRETNHQSTMRYLDLIEAGTPPISERECLSTEDQARELLAIGLRQMDGINFEQFSKQTGFSALNLFAPIENELTDAGLISINEESIRLTQKGILVCDWIASKIVNI